MALTSSLGMAEPAGKKGVVVLEDTVEKEANLPRIVEFYDGLNNSYNMSMIVETWAKDFHIKSDATLKFKWWLDEGDKNDKSDDKIKYVASLHAKNSYFEYLQSSEGFAKGERLYPEKYFMKTTFGSSFSKREHHTFTYDDKGNLEKIFYTYKRPARKRIESTLTKKDFKDKKMIDLLSGLLQQGYRNSKGKKFGPEYIVRQGELAKMKFKKGKNHIDVDVLSMDGNEMDLHDFWIKLDKDSNLKELYVGKMDPIVKDFRVKMK